MTPGDDAPAAGAPTVAVRVWDGPTRLFHWTLALLVAANVATGHFDSMLGANTLDWHRRFGYALLGLVAFRLVWGFAGGTHARFASFLKGPRAVLGYAKALASGAHPVTAGHNPMGGWSVVALLASVATQAITGLFIVQEDYGIAGPLSRFVSGATSDRMNSIHEANGWVLCALAGLHLAAIVMHTVKWREDLVGAMLSGVKRLPAGREAEAGRPAGWAAFVVALSLGAAVVAGLVALG